MLISEKITIFVTTWIIVVFFVTLEMELEIFLVLILIGFVIIKEFTDRYTTFNFKKRFNIFIFMFLIVFIFIVMEKVINILNI